ncbi:MAG TPA: amidophosphoribosyltransferase [Rhodospirillaceae bacterium]|nr:amidophosphoribosyltransferase [Rhodospirillaceae bacterium]HAA91877.1 amidophosphoribosyltransferase [Rhodospirillaceae bacterium]HAT36350.1 amidophosphoribosyltransferase [Rhodospirillaceae bacterium]
MDIDRTAKSSLPARWTRAVLDALLPQRCLCCGDIIDSAGAICSACWSSIDFLSSPGCECCGTPFPYEVAEATLCPACTAQPPSYDRARAAFEYDDVSRRLVTQFKYADQTDRAPAFGRMLLRVAEPLLQDADLLVPVPLHRWRLIGRRYNQAALLAQAVARSTGTPLALDLLRRRRSTPPQVGKSAAARRRNVAGAFALKPGAEKQLEGNRILLVDDVFTTGATVEECAKVLRRKGAVGVDVITLGRVTRPQALDI